MNPKSNKAKQLGELKWEQADTRTVIAAMAMQGSISNGDGCYDVVARDAVKYADELLEELSKTE
jgi:hypothetical protein